MSTIINLTCVQCTESVNGGFVIKLQKKKAVSVVGPFGTTTQTQQVTYYQKINTGIKLVKDIPVLDNGTPILGLGADIDLSLYQVTEMPYVIPEMGLDGKPNVNAGEIIQNKWLFLPSLAKTAV